MSVIVEDPAKIVVDGNTYTFYGASGTTPVSWTIPVFGGLGTVQATSVSYISPGSLSPISVQAALDALWTRSGGGGQPITITNNKAPYAWNAITQTLNIPRSPTITASGNVFTFDAGDGSAPISWAEFSGNNGGAASLASEVIYVPGNLQGVSTVQAALDLLAGRTAPVANVTVSGNTYSFNNGAGSPSVTWTIPVVTVPNAGQVAYTPGSVTGVSTVQAAIDSLGTRVTSLQSSVATIQSSILTLQGQAHAALAVTNAKGAFAWNAGAQTLNIPRSPVVTVSGSAYTFDAGDGSATVTWTIPVVTVPNAGQVAYTPGSVTGVSTVQAAIDSLGTRVTLLQSSVTTLQGQAHAALAVTNAKGAFAWNAGAQTLNIPRSPVVTVSGNAYTFDAGDGSATVTWTLSASGASSADQISYTPGNVVGVATVQAALDSLGAKSHVALTVTNDKAPYSWDVNTQVLNIPKAPTVTASGSTYTFDSGDGSTPVSWSSGGSSGGSGGGVYTGVIAIDGNVYSMNSAGITAAIGALPPTGGDIFLPPGTYQITSPIWLSKPNIRFRGCGPSTILDASGASISGQGVITVQANAVIVSDLKVIGSTGTVDYGIQVIAGLVGVTIERCWVQTTKLSGIYSTQSVTKIFNCFVTGCLACQIQGAGFGNGAVIKDCYCDGAGVGTYGIRVGGATMGYPLVEGNYVKGTLTYGLVADTGTFGARLLGNTLDGAKGVYVVGNYHVVAGNVIVVSGAITIGTNSANIQIRDNYINGNAIIDCGSYSDDHSFTNNTIITSAANAIVLKGNNRILFTGNFISLSVAKTSQNGIYLNYNASNALPFGCVFKNNVISGFPVAFYTVSSGPTNCDFDNNKLISITTQYSGTFGTSNVFRTVP